MTRIKRFSAAAACAALLTAGTTAPAQADYLAAKGILLGIAALSSAARSQQAPGTSANTHYALTGQGKPVTSRAQAAPGWVPPSPPPVIYHAPKHHHAPKKHKW